MSKCILGTGLSFSTETDVAERVISAALDHGILSFDTAPSYRTEGVLGQILAHEIQTRSIARTDIYIQTKIDAWQMQEGHIIDYIDQALKKLKVDYLDSLLIHWPVPEYMKDTWKQMEEAREKGLIKKLGICNVRMRQLNEYIGWKPDIIQIERHPLNTFEDVVDFCKNSGLEIQAYSPLCKMNERIKNSELLKGISHKYGKDIGQVVLRWHLDSGVRPIFTTTKTERLKQYTEIEDFQLSREEIEEIANMNENYKMYLESYACPGY